jgi:RND family efflux transporter MFP subunit
MSDKVKGIIQLILVILFIAGSFLISNMLKSERVSMRGAGGEERRIFVETVTVSPQTHRVQFDTTGTVQSRGAIGIVPQIQGRIDTVSDNLFEGGTFTADEILFQIDPRDFKLEIQRLQAAVAQAQTALNIEKAEGEAALIDWRQLNGDKPVPPLVAREPQLKEARANLQAARAQLANAKLDLERTKFSFPFDGRVISSDLEKGQFVMTGQSYGQVFDLSSLEVQASLEDKQLKWLLGSDNPKIKITANYLGEIKTYDGVLKRSAGSLDQQTRFARVSFGFSDENVDLLPGVFVDVDIEGSTLENVSVLPAEALQKEGHIWIVKADNTLKKHTPEIIYSTDKNIIIEGLSTNSRMVTSRTAGATEGMEVNIANEEADQTDKKSDLNTPLTSLAFPMED